MDKKDKHTLIESGEFTPLDIHFASFMEGLDGGKSPEVFIAAALTSKWKRQGNICFNLSSTAGDNKLQVLDNIKDIDLLKNDDFIEKLIQSRVIGKPGEFKPLILDDRNRVYLYRYWDYQNQLKESILQRVGSDDPGINAELLKKGLERYYPDNKDGSDHQKIAAVTSLYKKFCVITGGPGTGKTTAITRIMALLIEQAGSGAFRIALAAPTGKAAARLKASIIKEKSNLDCPKTIKNSIPEEAATIHRLLGTIHDSPYFKYNKDNPLPVDAVIVDEASMIDLALMSKLVQAVPVHARIIILGDKDQLASVEAGAVLGDICDRDRSHVFSNVFQDKLSDIIGHKFDISGNMPDQTGIHDCIIELKKNFRFGEKSGIGQVSKAINAGDGEDALRIIQKGRYNDISWQSAVSAKKLAKMVKDSVIKGFNAFLKASSPEEKLETFDHFRILCALRQGPSGVSTINTMIEKILSDQEMISTENTWYHGRPIMITRNDYDLKLFNGDVGIILNDSDTGNSPRAFFMSIDGTLRKLHPGRLPEHETVYAMTVHKSQGSEFKHVVLILPDMDTPVLTRELIYTGVTRAREKAEIWGIEDIFIQAVSRTIERTSGLRDALWGQNY